MSLIKPVLEKNAKGKVKRIFQEIKKTRKISKIPNFWRTLANNSNTLERTWESLKQVMGKGSIDQLTKELIYVAVSMTNSCEYCIRSHTLAAKKRGMTVKMLHELSQKLSGFSISLEHDIDNKYYNIHAASQKTLNTFFISAINFFDHIHHL